MGPALRGGRCVASYLLLGTLVLEAGVLDVIGPDGLALLVLGAQILHGLRDGQPAALDVLAADPMRSRWRGKVTGRAAAPGPPGEHPWGVVPSGEEKAPPRWPLAVMRPWLWVNIQVGR